MTEFHHDKTPNKRPLRTYAVIAATSLALLASSEKAEAAPHIQPATPLSKNSIEATHAIPKTELDLTEQLSLLARKKVINCLVERCVALTFDDGPGAHTEELLDILKDRDVDATFFVLGSLAEGHPDTIKRMHDEGHQVGGHSWNHQYLPGLSPQAAADDANRTHEVITRFTGEKPTVMRPPYGAINPGITAAINLPQMLWSIDPQDWKNQSTPYISSHVINNAHPGAVALMHDIYETTVDAVPDIIDGLRNRGYTLVTIETLFGGNPPTGIYREQSDGPPRTPDTLPLTE